MGCLYFVRHGQTIWNKENKICGASDIALTRLGHEQAVETGKKILEAGIKADEILYSPLIRAKDTAMHISEITGIPARAEGRLTEQNFGKYEATARDGREFKESKKQFAVNYGGGESMPHLAQRIYNLLDEVKASGRTCILVAHNGIARCVQSYFHEMTNDEYAAFGIDNCAVVKYEWKDEDGAAASDAAAIMNSQNVRNSNNSEHSCITENAKIVDIPGNNASDGFSVQEDAALGVQNPAFFGAEAAFVPALISDYRGIHTPRDLYAALSKLWCADTCAPRMRCSWTPGNPTLGQCSITAFLAQDIFGGKVYGIPRPGGNFHCYNVVGDCCFDLTSEQFGAEVLIYENNPEQFKEEHFAKEEKRLRYENLKQMLKEYTDGAV